MTKEQIQIAEVSLSKLRGSIVVNDYGIALACIHNLIKFHKKELAIEISKLPRFHLCMDGHGFSEQRIFIDEGPYIDAEELFKILNKYI